MCNIFPNDSFRIDQDRLVDLIDRAINQGGYLKLTVTNIRWPRKAVFMEFKYKQCWRGDLEWLLGLSEDAFHFKCPDNTPEYFSLFAEPHVFDIADYLHGFACEVKADTILEIEQLPI